MLANMRQWQGLLRKWLLSRSVCQQFLLAFQTVPKLSSQRILTDLKILVHKNLFRWLDRAGTPPWGEFDTINGHKLHFSNPARYPLPFKLSPDGAKSMFNSAVFDNFLMNSIYCGEKCIISPPL